jgi:hypothetical protein
MALRKLHGNPRLGVRAAVQEAAWPKSGQNVPRSLGFSMPVTQSEGLAEQPPRFSSA